MWQSHKYMTALSPSRQKVVFLSPASTALNNPQLASPQYLPGAVGGSNNPLGGPHGASGNPRSAQGGNGTHNPTWGGSAHGTNTKGGSSAIGPQPPIPPPHRSTGTALNPHCLPPFSMHPGTGAGGASAAHDGAVAGTRSPGQNPGLGLLGNMPIPPHLSPFAGGAGSGGPHSHTAVTNEDYASSMQVWLSCYDTLFRLCIRYRLFLADSDTDGS